MSESPTTYQAAQVAAQAAQAVVAGDGPRNAQTLPTGAISPAGGDVGESALVPVSYTDGKQIAPAKRGGKFIKGDPRINRKGRPKTFDQVRALFQSVAYETVQIEQDGQLRDMVIDNHIVTRVEAIAREWAASGDPKLQIAFMVWSFGKPPDEVKVKAEGRLTIVMDR